MNPDGAANLARLSAGDVKLEEQDEQGRQFTIGALGLVTMAYHADGTLGIGELRSSALELVRGDSGTTLMDLDELALSVISYTAEGVLAAKTGHGRQLTVGSGLVRNEPHQDVPVLSSQAVEVEGLEVSGEEFLAMSSLRFTGLLSFPTRPSMF